MYQAQQQLSMDQSLQAINSMNIPMVDKQALLSQVYAQQMAQMQPQFDQFGGLQQ